MILPNPLHPAQADDTAIIVEFGVGVFAGMTLLVSKSDTHLASAIASGDVVASGPVVAAVPVVAHPSTVQGGTSTVAGGGGGSPAPSADAPDDTI